MSKDQLKKDLNKLKALQSGLKKKKSHQVEIDLNLLQNDKPTTEKEISQIPSQIEKHSSEGQSKS